MDRALPAIVDLLPEPVALAAASDRRQGPARQRVVSIRRAFRDGYLAVAERTGPAELPARYQGQARDLLGFALEGAGMALGLADLLDPPAVRVRAQLAEPGFRFGTLVVIGAGWALARLRRPLDEGQLGLGLEHIADLADGFGFFECHFRPRATLERRLVSVPDPAKVDFDRGVGRAAWFLFEGAVEHLAAAMQPFPDDRKPALWRGVGFAATYAGGVGTDGLQRLTAAAGAHLEDCRAGVGMAIGVRSAAGDPAPAAELAGRVFAVGDGRVRTAGP